VNHFSSTFANASGARLAYQYWEDSSKAYAKAIILVHGLGYHGGSYPNLVQAMVSSGNKVVAMDLEGFGRSPGERGGVGDMGRHADDLEALRRVIKDAEGVREAVLVAHSLGAIVALAHAMRYPDAGLRMALISPLAAGAPPTLQASDLSNDEAWNAKAAGDPLWTPSISNDVRDGVTAILAKAKGSSGTFSRSKLLFMAGQSDEVAPEADVKALSEALAPKSCRFVSFPRVKHDPFAEGRRDQAFGALAAWLSETEFEYKAP
jgi:alpha-beta hydrolase superfamily lysophospholipase